MGHLAERAGVGAPQPLEEHVRLIRRNHERPLTACLTLDGMGLVDDPVPDGREDPAAGRDVAEQQRMIRDHHVGMRRAATGPVDEALVREERAEPAGALARRRREVGAVDAPPTDAECIEVAIGRLADIGVDHRDGRQGIGRVAFRRNFN